MKKFILGLVLCVLGCSGQARSETIFIEDFQDANYTGWTISGGGSAYVTYYSGNYSLRLTQTKQAQTSVDTSDFQNVSISIELAASSLEWNDSCIGEVSTNNGQTWTTVLQVVDGQDDGVTLYTGSYSNSSLDDNANLLVRVRAAGGQIYDYCWADNIIVEGDSAPTNSNVFDPLSGSGNVTRTAWTYSSLFSTSASLTDYSAFSVPANAANPSQTFSGQLELINESSSGSFAEQGTNIASAYTDPGHLPEFAFDFLQVGTHIVPLERGLIATSHPSWSYIIEPGRVWQENSDNGYSRAALPFSLQENGANCTHNGVMTWLFKDDGSVSNVAYQIVGETCAYFKFNMWGNLSANYVPATFVSAQDITDNYIAEVTVRMPTKSLNDLASDFPTAGVNVATIGNEQTLGERSAYGVVINGIHYTAGCETRYGSYPYCDVLSLPSYSTAKSVVGGIGLMRLEQKYAGSQKDVAIADWVPGCTASQWQDVSLEDALDMATGNYDNSGFEVDEGSSAMLNGFFLTYTDTEKLNFSCSYTRKSTPGSLWVYHTTDTYLLGRGINAVYQAWEGSGVEFYADMLVEELWKPLNLSPVTYTTLRTFDTQAQAYAGYGLTYHRDDVVKLADFLNKDAGYIDSTPMLDSAMLSEALQQTSNHGLDAGSTTAKYQNGFWAWNAKSTLGCSADTWIPYMSGYGGIGIVLLPGDITYYFFSDDGQYTFANSVKELDKIYDFCN